MLIMPHLVPASLPPRTEGYWIGHSEVLFTEYFGLLLLLTCYVSKVYLKLLFFHVPQYCSVRALVRHLNLQRGIDGPVFLDSSDSLIIG